MVQVAKELDNLAAEMYGAASFYSFLAHAKTRKNIIRVCKTITCSMKGKNQLIMVVEEMPKLS